LLNLAQNDCSPFSGKSFAGIGNGRNEVWPIVIRRSPATIGKAVRLLQGNALGGLA
jgi:hypothetical protein